MKCTTCGRGLDPLIPDIDYDYTEAVQGNIENCDDCNQDIDISAHVRMQFQHIKYKPLKKGTLIELPLLNKE